MAANRHESTLTVKYSGKRADPSDPAAIGTTTIVFTVNSSVRLDVGSGSYEANAIFDDVRELKLAARDDLCLGNNSLRNSLVERIGMEGMKRLMVVNRSSASSLVIGGAADNALYAGFLDSADSYVIVPRGGCFIWDSPITPAPVVAGSADQIRIAHAGDAGETITYGVVIEGTDADNDV